MKYVLIVWLIAFYLTGYGQFTLRGKVIAANSRTPLAGASVFLTNTSVGTVTNVDGHFALNIPAGRYDLIASYVGYETASQTISTVISDSLIIVLKPKVELLDDVIVGGFEKDGWNKWGRFFLDTFLGTSELGENCTILNSDVIKFRHNKKENKLYAYALDQLVIENNALGYLIKYQMEDFEYDFKSQYLLFLGYPLFSPMQGNTAKQRRWKRHREEAFRGSMMEFMRSVYRNKIVETGFEVRRLFKTPNEEKLRVRRIFQTKAMALKGQIIEFGDSTDYYQKVLKQPDQLLNFSAYTLTGDSIAYGIDSLTAGLEFGDYLHIIYKKASPPAKYRELSPYNGQMMSELKLIKPEALHIVSNGNYFPPLNLISQGYWAWSEKVGAMLPFDYRPGE